MNAIDLIEKANKEYSAEYAIGDTKGVSNHLPMCLLALEKIGATPDRLQSFYDWYVPRLEKRGETQTSISLSNWQQNLGKHSFNQEFFDFFESELKENGVKKSLSTFLPALLKGVGGAAFHPLIRLSFALDCENETEIAEALASWGMGYLKLTNSTNPSQKRSPLETFSAIENVERFKSSKYEALGIFNRMELVSNEEEYRKTVTSFGFDETDIAEQIKTISGLSLETFLSAPNFVTLHLVTSSHALRVVNKFYNLTSEDIFHYWVAWCAAYITLNAPKVDQSLPPETKTSSAELIKRAIDAENDHLNKLAYSCIEEANVYPDRPYKLAVETYANLISK